MPMDLATPRNQLSAASAAVAAARNAIAGASASNWQSPAADTYRAWYAEVARHALAIETTVAALTRTANALRDERSW